MNYIVRRVLSGLVVVLGVVTITFVVSRLVPSDPARLYAGARARPAQIDEVRANLNLDDPVAVQYVRYLGDLVQGDLGTSFATKRAITRDMADFLPATLELALLATLLAMIIGIPVGVWASARRGRARDSWVRLFAVSSVSIPSFWLALILQLFFASRLGWLPLAGRVDSSTEFTEYTRFFLVDSILSGNIGNVLDVVKHLALPVVVMTAYPLGLTIRLIRGSMLEVLGEQYVEAARVAGIPERTVLSKLALKNSLAPALTLLGLTFAYSVSSAFLVEAVFNWPGLGNYLTSAILRVDFPVIIAAALVITVIYVVVNLLLDLVQAKVDPRVEIQP